MPQQSTSNSGFSRVQWFLAILTIAVLVVSVLVTGYFSTKKQQTQAFHKASQTLFHGVDLRAAELRNAQKSMLGMYYASDEFAGADIEAFAAQLRQYMPALHSLGMVEHVDGAMLDHYEKWMAEAGNDSFQIHEYNLEGRVATDRSRETYLPIISVDSGDSVKRKLLGTNLSSLDAVASQLPFVIRSGEAFMVPIPDNWPVPGDTLIFQPAYFGLSSPTDKTDREQLFAGGIWMSIDLDDLLLKNADTNTAGTITLTVRSADNKFDVIAQKTTLGISKGIDVGYERMFTSTTLGSGASKLTLLFERQALMPKTNAMAILGIAFSLFTIGVLLIAFIYNWRSAQHERLYSLRAINKERENAELTLKSINDSVISLDANLSIVYLNPSAQKFLQLHDEEVLGDPFEKHVQLESVKDVDSEVESFPGLVQTLNSLENNKRVSFDVEILQDHLVGSTVKLTISQMHGIDGDADGCILVLEDVSKERKLRTELEFRANHDALTGSYNRFYFDKRLAQLVDDVPASGRSHALCYIDLDQFKIVNDTCGHPSGDRLLCELTDALRERLRASDVLARLGGDEFGIIICDADEKAALLIANKLYAFFQTFVFEDEGRAFPVHASIGFVGINADHCELQSIMSAADAACYTAKDSGRNALVVYSETDAVMSERQEEMNWLPILTSALSDSGSKFMLLVQGVADIGPKPVLTSITHYEFLLRLKYTDGELLTPSKFIKAAERYNLTRDIDRWVIKNALTTVARVQNELPQDCTFSINLSGQSAGDSTLLPFIAEQMALHSADPGRFWFEITETAAISHFANAASLITGIQALGSSVALDDFGSGLSSFGYLRQLPVDVLKIDGQFIKDIDTSDVAKEMVRAMHHVARAMGLKTVAEFVENETVLKELASIGVDYAQGYFIAMPCEIEEALDQAKTQTLLEKKHRKAS